MQISLRLGFENSFIPIQEAYLQPLRNPMNPSACEHSLSQMNAKPVKHHWQTVRSHTQSLQFSWGLVLDGQWTPALCRRAGEMKIAVGILVGALAHFCSSLRYISALLHLLCVPQHTLLAILPHPPTPVYSHIASHHTLDVLLLRRKGLDGGPLLPVAAIGSSTSADQ